MIYEYKKDERSQLLPLADGWEETLIWTCIQGFNGKAYADARPGERPQSAQFLVADFCFYVGKPQKELVMNHPASHPGDFVIMVPQTQEWSSLIEECYGKSCRKVLRYAFDKNPDVFDRNKLEDMEAGLKKGCTIEMINQKYYKQAKKNAWSYDLCSQFDSYQDYKQHGIGAVVIKNNEIVAGASSYGVYHDGIEIEVDTREDCRQRGYARAACARLIVACLDRGLYPSWDAQNLKSVGLAKQLGYQFSHEYTAYEVNW